MSITFRRIFRKTMRLRSATGSPEAIHYGDKYKQTLRSILRGNPSAYFLKYYTIHACAHYFASLLERAIAGDRLIYGHSACPNAKNRLPELFHSVVRQTERFR